MKAVTLHRTVLEGYLKQRFGPGARLIGFGPIGKETSGTAPKRYGYGDPIRLIFRLDGRVRRVVLETMKPGPFGHEHPADRAQAMLWDYNSYGRLPGHIKALDVGAFDTHGALFSVAQASEFFVLTEWADGTGYQRDLERLTRGGAIRTTDQDRVDALVRYLVQIHRVKRRDRNLYRRRLRELIGHGECIMGLTDSYPARVGSITADRLRAIEEACNRWRWKLHRRHGRLSQVHGDFHPMNVLFRRGVNFSVLDRSRGEWGEPADDITAMTINYLFCSLQRYGKLAGPFERLFRRFWDRYLAESGDRVVTETAAPFFAFRGLVIASPLWYPDLTIAMREAIFRFIDNVLAEERFSPADVNRYLQ
jgi:hypothetical protein